MRHNHIVALLIFFTTVSVALSIGTLILLRRVEHNTERVQALTEAMHQLERADALRFSSAITAADAITYRLCVREQVIRAAINADTDHDEPTLPLYDCTPDLRGGVAKLLNPKQTAALAAHVKRNHFHP